MKQAVLDFLSQNQAALPPRADSRHIVLASLGAVLATAALAWASRQDAHLLWVLGSFGASSVLLFAAPQAAFSQPRNLVVGYLLSTLIALAALAALGPAWWGLGLATGTAIAAMMLTRTVHPPAGSTPVIVFLLQPDGPLFVLTCVGGALGLVLMALAYHRLARHQAYPQYW